VKKHGQVPPDPETLRRYTPAMVRDRLHSAATAFDGAIDPAGFHAGPAQEEALARLEWLLTERQRCGLVVAEPGLGKSHLAAMAARRLGGLGAEVAVLSLQGLPEGEWLDLLLGRLPLDPASRAEPIRPWLKLENRLRENMLMERPTVLVFDDMDRGPADAINGIARLASAGEPKFASTVVVAMAAPAGLARVPDTIRSRAAVRIDLPAWSDDDVAAYVTGALRRTAADEGFFSVAAVTTLARFSQGVPRLVCRLAQLSAAAAAGEGLAQVDAATVERAWRELVPADHDPPQSGGATATGFEASGGRPQVQVVRRLWG
jgi:type II secretory pathway predicted ATPase ExeA